MYIYSSIYVYGYGHVRLTLLSRAANSFTRFFDTLFPKKTLNKGVYWFYYMLMLFFNN